MASRAAEDDTATKTGQGSTTAGGEAKHARHQPARKKPVQQPKAKKEVPQQSQGGAPKATRTGKGKDKGRGEGGGGPGEGEKETLSGPRPDPEEPGEVGGGPSKDCWQNGGDEVVSQNGSAVCGRGGAAKTLVLDSDASCSE